MVQDLAQDSARRWSKTMARVYIDGKLKDIRAVGAFLVLAIEDKDGSLWECKTGVDVKYRLGIRIRAEGTVTGNMTMTIKRINHNRTYHLEKFPYLINALEDKYILDIPTVDEDGRALIHKDNEKVKICDIYALYKDYASEHKLPIEIATVPSLGKVMSKLGMYKSKDNHFTHYWMRKRT